MALPANFFDNPNWWACHLHEAAAGGAGDDGDCSPYLNRVFETTSEGINRFWKETMMLDSEYGYWPQVHIGLPYGHVVSIVYFGAPRYDVEYRYCSPSGESVLLAVQGPNSMLPGFRWLEVKAISSYAPHIKPLVLLLLTPAAQVSEQEEMDAKMEINQALSRLGFLSAAGVDLATILARGLRSDIEWVFDESYGWVTDDQHCWRCPTRPKYGLEVMPESSFQAFKRFTRDLGLNPNSVR